MQSLNYYSYNIIKKVKLNIEMNSSILSKNSKESLIIF